MRRVLRYLSVVVSVSGSLAPTVAGAAVPCRLSDSDVQALALSPSHVTPASFLAFPSTGQKGVCNTRAAVKQLDLQKDVVTDATLKITMAYSAKYMSPAENDRMVDAVNDYWAKL